MKGPRSIDCAPGVGFHHYQVVYLPQGAHKPVTLRVGFRSAQALHLLSHGLQTRADMAECGCTTAAVKAVDRISVLRRRGFQVDSTRETLIDPETNARTWQARYRLLGRIRSIRGIGRTPPPAPPAPNPPRTPNWREIATA
jgi:hypothetical protein